MEQSLSLKIQIQQEREWISWSKEVNRIARVEIRLRETQIRRREKALQKLISKITNETRQERRGERKG